MGVNRIARSRLGQPSLLLPGGNSAQATVEYALTIVALLAIVVALAALWRAGEQGVLSDLVEEAASHGLDAFGALDISLY